MKSTAWVFSWSALCRSARMRISAAFSTDRLLHRASSHITFRRSRAYCKIQAKVQLQRTHLIRPDVKLYSCSFTLQYQTTLLCWAGQCALLYKPERYSKKQWQQKKRDKEQNHDVPTLRKAMERKHTHHNSAQPPCVTGVVVLCSCFEMRVQVTCNTYYLSYFKAQNTKGKSLLSLYYCMTVLLRFSGKTCLTVNAP